MRRLFYMALGAVVGVLVVRKVQQTARAYSPSGLAERAGGLGESLRYFADQVRAGMAERELELRDALGLDDATHGTDTTDASDDTTGTAGTDRNGHHHLAPDEAARLIEHPTRHRRSAG